jgi:hypothetical protein
MYVLGTARHLHSVSGHNAPCLSYLLWSQVEDQSYNLKDSRDKTSDTWVPYNLRHALVPGGPILLINLKVFTQGTLKPVGLLGRISSIAGAIYILEMPVDV